MAQVRTDNVQIKLDIDGSQSKTELDNLTRKAQVLKNDLKEMKRGTDEYVAANKELREVNKRIAELHEELGTAGLSMGQLQNRSKQLNRELKDLVPGTEAFISKSRQLAEVDGRLNQVRDEVRSIGQELDKSGGGFLDFVKKSAVFAGVQLGIEGVVSSLKQLGSESIDAAKTGSDSISDMEKSLNVTTAEAKALREQLEGIDTRTSEENLEGIAVAAGQLGIAKDQAVDFTVAVDQAVVALGDEFTGGVEDVTKSLGGLQKLFKQTSDLTPAEAITKIGSAVNALGAEGMASGPVIAEFTARIGQLGDLSPEITQTMGLGAAFQELGLSAEISSGGLTNVLLTAAKDTAGFSKQIGLTDKEFRKLLNSDPNEVILKLADSMKGASNTEIVATLDQLGIKSQEATKVMSLLANQTDFVREKQKLAAAEFAKGTSLYEEYLKKNTNAAAQIEIAEKSYAKFRRELGEQLIPVYIKLLQYGGLVLNALRALPGFVSENRAAFGALALAVLAFNAAQIVEQATTLKTLALKKLVALQLLTEEAGSYRLVTAKSLLTRAQTALNAAMRANPIGIILTVVALAVLAFNKLYESSETFRNGINGLGAAAERVFKNMRDVAVTYLGGIGNLLAGIFTADPARIKEGLKGIGKSIVDGYTGLGTGAADAFRTGYASARVKAEQEQKAAEEAAFKKGFEEQTARNKKAAEEQAAAREKAVAATKEELLEQLKLRQAALDMQLAKAKEGSEQELKLKKQLVLVARDMELLDEKKTAGDKAVIRAKAQIELDKLNTDYAKKQAELRKKEAEKAAKQAEEEALAEAANMKRRADLELDEYKRRAGELQAAAAKEAEKLKGTDEQIAEGRRLIAKRLEQDLLLLEKERVAKQAAIMREIEQVDEQIAIRRAQRAREKAEAASPFGGAAELATEQATRMAAMQSELDAVLAHNKRKADELRAAAATETSLLKGTAEEQAEGQRSIAENLAAQLGVLDKQNLSAKSQFNADREQLDEDYLEHSRERLKEEADFVLGNAAAGIQLLADFSKISSEKELARVEKDKNQRLAKTEAEYKAGKISKEKYEAEKTKIEADASADTRRIKKEAAENEKKAAIATAIIQGVLAVLKAAPNIPLQIATGVLAAASVAKIVATPIPEFAKGGVVGSAWRGAKQSVGAAYQSAKKYASGGRINPTAGVPDAGQLHSGGGIKMLDGATGEYLGEWERGEPYMILSRNTYANNREIIDQLLDTSLHRGGAPIRRRGIHAADGAVVGELPTTLSRGGGDQAEVVLAIKENTATMRELAAHPRPAVIHWKADDTLNLDGELRELNGIREDMSA